MFAKSLQRGCMYSQLLSQEYYHTSSLYSFSKTPASKLAFSWKRYQSCLSFYLNMVLWRSIAWMFKPPNCEIWIVLRNSLCENFWHDWKFPVFISVWIRFTFVMYILMYISRQYSPFKSFEIFIFILKE
mgnify:CR=1 FL=1